MSLVTLPRLLLRAPLLPVRALRDPVAALERDPLGAAALELAGPGGASPAALHRFARRAAFRPTPRALWAGVAVAELGERTRVATGRPRPRYTVSWSRLAQLGRTLLAEPRVREQARLRAAPSLLVRGGWALWMGPGADGPAAEAREAEVSPALAAVLDATEEWAPWPRVREAAARALTADDFPADEVDVDDLLLLQIDDGLLCHDLAPPLVGPPPLDWMRARLARAEGAEDASEALNEIARRLDAGDLRGGRAALSRLGGAAGSEPIHSVLVHETRVATLSTDAVLRAASIAPLLLRLQDALAPPAAERALEPAIGAAVDALVEAFGAGAYPLAPLALGDFGIRPEPRSEPPAPPPPPPALLALLASRFAAARNGVARFTAEELDPVLPDGAPPATMEIVLAPCREPRGAPPGTDWLLGLHAPAGATWGRFAHAVGEPLVDALVQLARAERTARAGEARLDIAFTPSPSLADLATHPPLRDATLALSSWPDSPAVTPADLELVTGDDGLALRSSWGQPVAPSPLTRLRSTTAPPGVYQLLAGWSLHRQHAPWALAPGPFVDLDDFPRVVVDGFVVAPRSWRIPGDVLAACRRGDGETAIRRWRKGTRIPRLVQIGHEDELLLVDLDAPIAPADLARVTEPRPRAWEVWPPLDRLVDRDGRRVEAVVAVARFPDEPGTARDVLACAAVGRVAPPDENRAAAGWRTFKLYGDADRQDRVLVGAVAPAIRAALADEEIDAWFFLRYVEPPGRREHLRVRVHASSAAEMGAFATRLAAALAPARSACDVVAVDEAEYRRETARYGGAASLEALERVFQAESELACALYRTDDPDLDPVTLAVRALDALAIGLGLTPAARGELARARREATADALGDAAAEYRRRQRRLVAALSGDPADSAAMPLARFAAAVRAAAPSPPGAALASILHMCVNRLAGTDPDVEALVYYLWDRALESVRARAKGSRRRRRSS